MRMGSNHAVTGNPQREPRIQSESLLTDESALESDLENRKRNLDKLVDSTYVAVGQESFEIQNGLHGITLQKGRIPRENKRRRTVHRASRAAERVHEHQ